MLIVFIVANMLTLLLVVRMIRDYKVLKKLLPKTKVTDRFSLPVAEVIFSAETQGIPEARRIQKQLIRSFCIALILLNAATLIYTRFIAT